MNQPRRKKIWKYSLDLEPILAMYIVFQFLLSVAANEMGKCVQTEWFCSFICLSCFFPLFFFSLFRSFSDQFQHFPISKSKCSLLMYAIVCVSVCMCQYGECLLLFSHFIFSLGLVFFLLFPCMESSLLLASVWLLDYSLRISEIKTTFFVTFGQCSIRVGEKMSEKIKKDKQKIRK